MTPKKQPTKQASPAETDNTHAYGKKSGPPKAGMKEMSDEQSEPSSKDQLHKTGMKLVPKPKKAK
jgi:hypothetical protein